MEPTPIWWIWVGQQCTPVASAAGDSEAEDEVGGEATRKACGVLVARLQGNSWVPPPSTGK